MTGLRPYMLDAARHLYGPEHSSHSDDRMGGGGGELSADRAFGGRAIRRAVGIGADSPIGPIRLQYGLSTTGRRNCFARIGRWID